MRQSPFINTRMSTSERIRVLQIVPCFGVGGAEQMACHLMVGLSSSLDVAGASLYAATNSSIESRLAQANIPVWHLDKRPGFDPRMFFALDRVLGEVQPHVVHTHLSILRYALPALLRRRVPLVVHTLHNLAEYEADTVGRLIQSFAFRRRVLPVAISQEVAASFERLYGLECKAIVPNCIPVDDYRAPMPDRARWREKEGLSRDAVLFTCVGRLEAQKNHLMLLESFAALQDTRAQLVLLGDGSLKRQLEAYVRTNGLEARVHLLGKRGDIPEFLAASDVFVLSSSWEGNPLAVMEAMAAGLPVIGTAVGGVPELVQSGEHGLIVPPRDSTAFTNAMRALLDDPDRRRAMGNAAHARATAAFSLERMVQGYTSLYKSADSSRATPASAAARAWRHACAWPKPENNE